MRTSAHSNVQALGLGLLLGLGLCLPPGLQAALPDTLNYQGRVRLTSGAAVADSTANNVAFALYTQATGGTPIWSENQSGVTTTAGLFNVVLGSVTPLTVPFDQPYWLGVNFNGDGEMAPRTPLTMAPYAFRAKYADSSSVAAPLSLTLNSATGAPLFVNQQAGFVGISATAAAGGTAIHAGGGTNGVSAFGLTGVYGEGTNTGVYAYSPSGDGVVAQSTGGSGSAIYAVNNNGTAIRTQGRFIGVSATATDAGAAQGGWFSGITGVAGVARNGGAGVIGRSDGVAGLAYGVVGSSDATMGIGVFGQAPKGMVAQGVGVGLSATASMSPGTAVYGHGQIAFEGVGALDLHAQPAPSIPGAGRGRIYYDLALGRFRVSESGGSFVDLVSGSVSAPLSLTLSSGTAAALYVSNTTASAVSATASGTGPVGAAIYAQNTGMGDGHFGVFGQAVNGRSAGVYGSGTSASAQLPDVSTGVMGLDSVGTGVFGKAKGTGGVGVSGDGDLAGLSGTAAALNGAGVYGIASYSGPGTTYGVRGVSTAQAGFGVHGENLTPSGIGVFGIGGIGVFGEPSFGTGTGVEARQGVGTWALSVSGAARFQHGPVDFTGATVTGLPSAVPNPLYISGTAATAVIEGDNQGSGAGVRGVGSNTGSVGVHGLGSGAPAVGVLAESVSGAALRLSGSALIDAANGGTITVASFVSFTAGTNLSSAISAPLSLTLNAAGAAPIYGEGSNASGTGLEGRGGSYGVHGTGSDATSSGVFGITPANSSSASYAGVVGQSTGTGSNPVGVIGRAQGSASAIGVLGTTAVPLSLFPGATTGVYGYSVNGHGVRGVVEQTGSYGVSGHSTYAGTNGYGVLGTSAGSTGAGVVGSTVNVPPASDDRSGVYGVAANAAHVGVLARNTVGGLALKVSGNANFGYGTVDFSGVTVTGLPLGVPNPLFLSNGIVGPVIDAENNSDNGIALRGRAFGIGGVGVEAAANTTNGRALRVTSSNGAFGIEVNATSTAPGIQVNSSGGGNAVQVNASGGTGVYASNNQAGASAIQGWAFASNAVAVQGGANNPGSIGLSGHAYDVSATALRAENAFGGRAFEFHGPGLFAGVGSVSYTTHVDFSGATVTGLALGVSAPLSLTQSAAGPPTLNAYNSAGGSAVVASSTGGGGTMVVSNTGGGQALSVSNTTFGAVFTGEFTNHGSTGRALLGTGGLGSSNARGVEGRGYYGVYGSTATTLGHGVYAENLAGGVALAARGGSYGVSATATAGSGIAVLGRVSSSAEAGRFFNDGSGHGLYGVAASSGSAGLVGESTGNGYGVWGYSAGTGIGVRGTGAGASSVGVLAENTAGGTALMLGGSNRIDSLGAATITVGSYVSFTAGTNLGGASLPISGSASVGYPGAAIQALNTGSGHGVQGRASLPGADSGGPLAWGSTLTAGVQGFSDVSMSAGVIGLSGSLSSSSAGVLGMGLNGSGVIGYSFGPGREGGEFTSDNGIGVKGSGLTGVAAVTTVLSGTALVATTSFPNGTAARFQGRVLMEGNLSSPGDVLAVTQSSGLAGMNGIASYNNASASAAVRGVSFDTTVPSGPGVEPGRGVEGMGPIGIVATTNLADGIGLVASVSSATAAGTAILAINEGLGSAINAQSEGGGTGVRGTGQIGVQAESYQPGGIGLQASASGAGGRAIRSFGDAVFDPGAGPSSVTFNTHVHFSGAVTGISVGVPNPLNLSNSLAAPVIYGQNFGTGAGLRGDANGASGIGVYGHVNAASNSGSAVYGENMGSGNIGSGVEGWNSSGFGFGVTGNNNASSGAPVGVFGRAEGTAPNRIGVVGATTGGAGGFPTVDIGVAGRASGGIGVYGVAGSAAGFGVRAANSSGTALLAEGGPVGISATASGGGGIGAVIQGRSTGVSITASDDTATEGHGVYVNIPFTGSTTNYGVRATVAGDTAYGVYGMSLGGAERVGVFGSIDPNYPSHPTHAGVVGHGGMNSHGVAGFTETGFAAGAYGQNNSAGTGAWGVMGVVGASSGGAGVVGASTASPPSPSGRIGVYGYATASGSSGVFGINPFAGGVGVWGHGAQIGVSATTNSASGYGLWAENTATTGFATAIRARVVSTGTPAAIWAEGSGSGHGVFATQTTLGVDGRAAISARNPTTSVAGSPATALDIDGGITMNTTRADRAAGQTSIALGGCSGASPVMQSGSIVLNNNQITATSLILATALGTSAVAYPVTVRITAQGPGSATLTAYAIGQGTTCPSIGNIAVNYLIINQR